MNDCKNCGQPIGHEEVETPTHATGLVFCNTFDLRDQRRAEPMGSTA